MPDDVVRLSLGVCVVRSAQMLQGSSRLNYSLGISRETCGATRLALSLVVVPPGAAARPHYHLAGDTLIHILQGRSQTRYGQHLSQSVVNGPGDFIYIGAGLPHAPRNLSDSAEAIAINARTDPSQQEPIVPLEPSETLPVTWRADSLHTLSAPAMQMAAPNLSLERVVFAAHGERQMPDDPMSETGLYVAQGAMELTTGEALQHAVVCTQGDFVFVPMGLTHRWSNIGNEQASVVLARSGVAA